MPCCAAAELTMMTSSSNDVATGSGSVAKIKWRRHLTWAPGSGVVTSSPACVATSSTPVKVTRRLRSFWKKFPSPGGSGGAGNHGTGSNGTVPRIAVDGQLFDEDAGVQFFKEERTDDAVYNVYLKKVQYHIDSSTTMESPEDSMTATDDDDASCEVAAVDGASSPSADTRHLSDGESSSRHQSPTAAAATDSSAADDRRAHLQWRLEEVRVIKYGTLSRLVAALSSESGQLEVTNVNTFLTTWRTFASTAQVVDELVKRYQTVGADCAMKQEVRDGHRRTIRTVISAWLDAYPDDFRDPPLYPALDTLQQFVTEQLPDSDLAERIRDKLSAFRLEANRLVQANHSGCMEPTSELHHQLRKHHQDLNANYSANKSFVDTFLSLSSRHFAEQLTHVDADLFKKVIPQQCLGSVWSRRASSVSGTRQRQVESVATVSATIDHFNAVTLRVIATVVHRLPVGKSSDRVAVIEKWIDIAQECRRLKNFSSLKAIVSGLQCTAVYRLTKLWNSVNKQKLTLFEDLSSIFSEANNQQTCREVLNKEGTAKFANDTRSANTLRSRKKSWSWGSVRAQRSKSLDGSTMPVIQGTVPYLGTFLTDLMMIDTAFHDTMDGGLINFEKRRKEFEILAQIKLFQSAANLYRISPDAHFTHWFNGIPTYDENESYELSCEIEPEMFLQSTPPTKSRQKKFSFSYFSPRRRSSSMISSSIDDLGCSSGSSCGSGSGSAGGSGGNSRSSTLLVRKDSRDAVSVKDMSSGLSPAAHRQLRHSISAGSLLSPLSSRSPCSSNDIVNGNAMTSSVLHSRDRLVVKVFLDISKSHEAVHYKSILLVNSDRTQTVLRNALMKYDIVVRPEDYFIVQLLPDGSELALPHNGNVFYAVNRSVPEIKFMIREKPISERCSEVDERHEKTSWRRKSAALP